MSPKVDNKLITSVLEGASVFAAGMVAGSALYISMIEVPARKDETAEYQLRNWQHCFPLAVGYLKPFGMFMNFLLGATVYKTGKKDWWLPFGCFFFLGPFTAIKILPTNKTLLALEQGSPEDVKKAGELIPQWGKLHGIRTWVALIGFGGAIAAMAN